MLAVSGCYRLSSTTPLVLWTTVGIPVAACEWAPEMIGELSAEIAVDWGDGTLDQGHVFWDNPTGHCFWHTYAAPGTYQGRVSISPGQTGFSSRTLTVTVAPASSSYIGAAGTCPCHTGVTLSATGLASVVGLPGVPLPDPVYSWTFGDGTTAITNAATVRHTYATADTYVVSVTAVRSAFFSPNDATYHLATAWTTASVKVGP